MAEDVMLSGYCDGRFRVVRDLLAESLQGGEIGAALAVYLDGKPVIDLWGGWADATRLRPWREHTVVCMMSVTKAMIALCAHRLIQKNMLDLERPVAAYWPEFARNDKGGISVDCLLSHRAGLIFPDEAPPGSMADWDVMTAALARQAPAFEPDTRGAYHSSTYGHLVGELLQRAGGKHILDILRDEITGPVAADYFLGVPRDRQADVADIIVHPDTISTRLISSDLDAPLSRAWRPLARQPDVFNSAMWRNSLLPSANGHGTARAAARIFAALFTGVDGVRLLDDTQLEILRTQRWFESCALTGRAYRFGRGVALNNRRYHPMGPDPRAFGHAGVGGSFVFADPETGLSFGFAKNHTAVGDGVGKWTEALVDELYRSLGQP